MTKNIPVRKELNPAEERKNKADVAYAAASGMIKSDLYFILKSYPLLVAAQFWVLFAEPAPSSQTTYLAVAQRTCELLFLYLICRRWLSRLGLDYRNRSTAVCLRLLVYGLAYWAVTYFPLQPLAQSQPNQYTGVLVFAVVPILIISLCYFFFFFPIVLGDTDLKSILKRSFDLVRGDIFLPIKSFLAPLGFLLLLTAIPAAISPDGRIEAVEYVKTFFYGVLWLLESYISLSLALFLTGRNELEKAGVDLKRLEEFSLISKGIKPAQRRILTPSSGLVLICLSGLLWLANIASSFSMKPAPDIAVGGITVEGKTILLELHLSDPEYHFAGFKPVYFRLAGESGSVVSPAPTSAAIEDYDEEVIWALPKRSRILLYVSFKTARQGEDLASLKDLYLYYKGYRIVHLDMNKATVVDE